MSLRSPGFDRDAAGVFAALVVWLGATLPWRPLMLPDEGRYAGVAWEMLRSGDWLTPTLDGLPFFHKPPLFYWITALSLHVFGVHPAAARVAPLLGAILLGLALYLFVRRWFDRTSARASLLVLATQPLFFVGSQFANLDMLVAGCIGATLLLCAHVVLSAEQGRPARSACLAAWGCAGLGVLAKGLIGVVVPALVLLAWGLATRRARRLATIFSPLGVLLFLAIVLPWHVAMQLRYPDFLHYYLVVQHFQRFGAGGFNNAQPIWFYPAVLALFGLPWVAWLVRTRRRAWWSDPARSDLRLLMGLWLLVVLVFFSLPQSKLVGYILPALPPLAVLIGEAAGPAPSGGSGWERWRAGAAVAAVVCLGTVGVLALYPMRTSNPLALALHGQVGRGEPVIFVGSYYYDLPLLAELRANVLVVDDWDRPGIDGRDNWRRELAEAARFDPASAATHLIVPGRLAATLCGLPSAWLVASRGAVAGLPWLGAVEPVAHSGEVALWHLKPGAATPGCRGMPNDAPAGR